MGLLKNKRLMGLCLVLSFFYLVACSSEEKAISIELNVVKARVDLKHQLPGDWSMVCVIGPYSTNEHTQDILGFSYDVIGGSQIYSSDSIALLVTHNDGVLNGVYEVNRKNADFTQLHGQCFDRELSEFEVKDEGWPHVEPAN